MPDLGPIMSGIAEALGPALRSFFMTLFVMTLAAVAFAITGYILASEGSILRGLLASTLALTATGFIGFTIAWKRALASGAVASVRKRRVASYLVNAVFERLLGVEDAGEVGARGGRIAQTVERIPLNQAVSKLRLAVIHQVKAAPAGGGFRGALRRKIEARLLASIEQLTLARFRDEAATQGGIDLIKVRNELATAADEMIADRIQGAMTKMTVLLVAVALAISIGGAFGIRQIPM